MDTMSHAKASILLCMKNLVKKICQVGEVLDFSDDSK